MNGITVWSKKTYESRQVEWFPSDESILKYLHADIKEYRSWINLKNISKKEVNSWSNSSSRITARVVACLIIDSTNNIISKHCI